MAANVIVVLLVLYSFSGSRARPTDWLVDTVTTPVGPCTILTHHNSYSKVSSVVKEVVQPWIIHGTIFSIHYPGCFNRGVVK